MVNIFISYARKDAEFVNKLADDLRRRGSNISLWMDTEDIPAGSLWREEIERALNAATLMILVLSANSILSKNVEREWEFFEKNNKRILPIRIDVDISLSQLPRKLSARQYIDFVGKPYIEALNALINALREDGARFRELRREDPTAPVAATVETKPDVKPRRKISTNTIAKVFVPIIVALIGFAGTLGPSIVERLSSTPVPTLAQAALVQPTGSPALTNVPTDTAAATQTKAAAVPAATTVVATDETATTVTSTSLSATPAAATEVPATPVPGTVPSFTLVYSGSNSLTIIFTAGGDAADLQLSTVKGTENVVTSFDIFTLVGTIVEPGTCLRYELDGATDALPRNCRNPHTLELSQADVFWYDDTQNRLLDIVVKQGSTIKTCSAASPSCDVP